MYLRFSEKGGNEVYRVEAFKNVVIKTEKDTARSNNGVYDLDTGIATLTGNVRLTKCDNQLNGEKAEINLNTGISKLLASTGTKKGRARVLISTSKKGC